MRRVTPKEQGVSKISICPRQSPGVLTLRTPPLQGHYGVFEGIILSVKLFHDTLVNISWVTTGYHGNKIKKQHMAFQKMECPCLL